MDTIFDYYSTIIYNLCDYYNNSIPDEVGYYDYDEEQLQIEQCYEEYELQKEVEALIEERSWEVSLRYMSIRRIALEAIEKRISITLIYKFFKEYNIQPNEQVWFWMEYYDY